MGLMDYGQGAQTFTDNFLKTYMAIGEDRRAEEAQKIAKQMAEAKLAEYAREQAMQAEAQQLINSYQQPASATFRNPNAFNMTQNQPPVNGLLSSIQGLNQQRPSPMMPQSDPTGFLALSNNNPTIQRQFPSKIDMLRATGRDPETEILSSLQNVVAKYDPVRGATLMANTEGKNNALMQAMLLAQMRDATANRGIDVRESLGNQANETRLDIAKLRAELAQSGRYGITPAQSANIARGIRSQMDQNSIIKEYRDISTKFGVMEKALQESKTSKNLIASDQALITLFNKMTDPNSVVRESEYARTPNDQALLNTIYGKAEKVIKGGAGLTGEERDALVRMGRNFYSVYKTRHDNEVSKYKELATESGINPNLVTLPYTDKEVPQQNRQTKRDLSSGVNYLKKAKNKREAISRIRSLASPDNGWTREELDQIASEAGW